MPATCQGDTTVYGYLLGVGTDGLGAVILPRDDRPLAVSLLPGIADVLRPLVGRDVGIEGVACWRIEDWEVLTFAATRVTEYRPDELPLTEAFRQLAEAANERWDGVDAVEYVRNLRYGNKE